MRWRIVLDFEDEQAARRAYALLKRTSRLISRAPKGSAVRVKLLRKKAH